MQNTPEEHCSAGGIPKDITLYGNQSLPFAQPNYNATSPHLTREVPLQSTQQVFYHNSSSEPTQTPTICGVHRRTFSIILFLLIFILLAAAAGGTAGGILYSYNKSPITLPASTTSSSPTIGLFKYLGCYTDSSSRALTASRISNSSMTNMQCASICAGFTYFGTEFGKSQVSYPYPSSSAPASTKERMDLIEHEPLNATAATLSRTAMHQR